MVGTVYSPWDYSTMVINDVDQNAFHCVWAGLSPGEKLVTLEGCDPGQHVDVVV